MAKCLTHGLRGFNGAVQRRLATLTVSMLISSCWQLSSEVELRRIFDVCKRWANSGSHEFVKKNMVRRMRPYGRFAHCSCKVAVRQPPVLASCIEIYHYLIINSVFRYNRPKRAVGTLRVWKCSGMKNPRPRPRVSAAFLHEQWANRPYGLMYRTIATICVATRRCTLYSNDKATETVFIAFYAMVKHFTAKGHYFAHWRAKRSFSLSVNGAETRVLHACVKKIFFSNPNFFCCFLNSDK